MRIIYSLGAYSYMCAAFLTPLFLLAPVLAIWIGVFPIDLNARIPAAFALYYGMTLLTLYYSRSAKHLVYLWFASTANLILWYTYARAVLGVIISHLSCGTHKITFEVTQKVGLKHPPTRSLTNSMSWVLKTTNVGNQAVSASSDIGLPPSTDDSCGETRIDVAADVDTSSKDEEVEINTIQPEEPKRVERTVNFTTPLSTYMKDLGIPILTLVLCFMSIGAGIWLEVSGQHSHPIQLISVLWCAYNTVAPLLVIYYTIFKFKYLGVVSRIAVVLSLVAVTAVLVAMHAHNRDVYDYNEVIGASLKFYEAQRSGVLPSGNRIPWRGDSGLLDRTANGSSLVGGYYDAGDTVKYGFPAAVSMSFLAWAMVEFPDAFKAARQVEELRATLKWDLVVSSTTGGVDQRTC